MFMKKKGLKLIKILFLGLLALIIVSISILYFSLHKKMPEGISGVGADQLALKIQEAIHHDEFEKTRQIQWTFGGKHHYLWDKENETVKVSWNDHEVKLNLKNVTNKLQGKILNTSSLSPKENEKIIKQAFDYFNNDSFWLVAPHKLFDKGTTRKLVPLENGTNGLLVTYNSGGSTPGDSYLWKTDKNFLPTSFQMWVSIIPIGGIEATWEEWKITESGILVSHQHQLLGFGIPISNIKTWK